MRRRADLSGVHAALDVLEEAQARLTIQTDTLIANVEAWARVTEDAHAAAKAVLTAVAALRVQYQAERDAEERKAA